MAKLFLSILNMSLTASIIIALVLLARLCLRKAPKIYSYILWSVVLFRLLCPVTITVPASVLSLFSASSESGASEYTTSMQYISPEFTAHYEPTIPEARTPVTAPVNNDPKISYTAEIQEVEKQPTAQHSAKEIALAILGWLWLAGVVVFVGYTSLQYIQLNRRLKFAYRLRGNIFESDEIETAFVLGMFNPRIYLPCGLSFDVQKAVIAHEQTHQRRGDHVVKILAYLALALHWFNPLVWLSFKLACDDMEKSCDEAVLRNMRNRGYEEKSVKVAYGQMLYALGSGQRNLFSPVSFAETGIKGRVKNVLNYRRLTKATSVILSVSVVFALAACVANPKVKDEIETTHKASAENISEPEMITIDKYTFLSDTQTLSLDLSEFNEVEKFDLSVLGEFAELRTLCLKNHWYENLPGVSALSMLPNLETIEFIGSYISDDTITALSRCKSLKRLVLTECTLPDLEGLNKLENIVSLDIRGVVYPEEDSEGSLFAGGTYMPENIFHTLKLTGLSELGVSLYLLPASDGTYSRITDETVDVLNVFTAKQGIENLMIEVSHGLQPMDDYAASQYDDISAVSKIKGLTELRIYSDMVNASALQNIASLKKLELETTDNVYVNSHLGDSLAAIEGLNELYLRLDCSNPIELYELGNLSNLKELALFAWCEDYSFLSKMGGLKVVSVTGPEEHEPNIDMGLFVSSAECIEEIFIHGAAYNYNALSQMSVLRRLNVTPVRSFDSAERIELNALSQLDKLEHLCLAARSFDSLSVIEALPLLNNVELYVDAASAADVLELSARLDVAAKACTLKTHVLEPEFYDDSESGLWVAGGGRNITINIDDTGYVDWAALKVMGNDCRDITIRANDYSSEYDYACFAEIIDYISTMRNDDNNIILSVEFNNPKTINNAPMEKLTNISELHFMCPEYVEFAEADTEPMSIDFLLGMNMWQAEIRVNEKYRSYTQDTLERYKELYPECYMFIDYTA